MLTLQSDLSLFTTSLGLALPNSTLTAPSTTARAPEKRSPYSIALARSAREVDEAQKLRYQVFVEEMGAELPAEALQRHRDADEYDADCEHLLVRDNATGNVVGCYRIMRPDVARRRGGFYADSEFDLSRLANIRSTTAEVGRACIHPDFRSGSVIMMLWSGLSRFMVENGVEYVIGCASIPLADGHENALAVYRDTARKCLAPSEYRVFPKNPYPVPALDSEAQSHVTPHIPALIKGYTRLGAWIGGAPAWDPHFNTADLFVLLPIARMKGAYAKHFLAA
jgi:putative hemolysin